MNTLSATKFWKIYQRHILETIFHGPPHSCYCRNSAFNISSATNFLTKPSVRDSSGHQRETNSWNCTFFTVNVSTSHKTMAPKSCSILTYVYTKILSGGYQWKTSIFENFHWYIYTYTYTYIIYLHVHINTYISIIIHRYSCQQYV